MILKLKNILPKETNVVWEKLDLVILTFCIKVTFWWFSLLVYGPN